MSRTELCTDSKLEEDADAETVLATAAICCAMLIFRPLLDKLKRATWIASGRGGGGPVGEAPDSLLRMLLMLAVRSGAPYCTGGSGSRSFPLKTSLHRGSSVATAFGVCGKGSASELGTMLSIPKLVTLVLPMISSFEPNRFMISVNPDP